MEGHTYGGTHTCRDIYIEENIHGGGGHIWTNIYMGVHTSGRDTQRDTYTKGYIYGREKHTRGRGIYMGGKKIYE